MKPVVVLLVLALVTVPCERAFALSIRAAGLAPGASAAFLEPATFTGGQTVFARVEVADFQRRDGRGDIVQDVALVAPMGFTIIDQKDAGGVDYFADSARVSSQFVVPGGPAGRWVIRVTVHDRVAGVTEKVELPFTIEAVPAGPPAAPPVR